MELSIKETPLYSLKIISQALMIEILVLVFAFACFGGLFKDSPPPKEASIDLVLNEEQSKPTPPEPPKPKVVPLVKPTLPQMVKPESAPISNQPAENLVKETVTSSVASRNETSAPSEPSVNKPDPMSIYRGQVNSAIQAATSCSSAAKNMELKGKVRVQFNLLDSAPSVAKVINSSGVPILDNLALNAVQNAKYPKPPTEFIGQIKQMSVLVNLNCDD